MDDQRRETSDAYVHVIAKWRMIACYWLAQAMFLMLFGPVWVMQANSVAGPGHPLGEWQWNRVAEVFSAWGYWGLMALIIGGIMLLQTVLVWPVRRPRMRSRGGWPVWLSLATATLMGTLLAAGLALGLIALAQVRLADQSWDGEAAWWAFVGWSALSYVTIGVTLFMFCSRELHRGRKHERVLARIAATIFKGTLVEAAAIMPIDVMFRKRQDCYCYAGTFWAYTLLLGAGLVVAGPAILLPILMRRRKRWYASRCDCCGYDMSGHVASGREVERCPECGAGWRYEPSARAEDVHPGVSSARAEGS